MGGKLAFASFSPLFEETAGKLQLYRCSHRQQTDFSSLPLLREEENWQLQLYRCSHRRSCEFNRTATALPLLAWAVNSHLPVFLHSLRKQLANCSFTAALIGSKLTFPVYLCSERRKTGNCSFTAALIGGKVDFPAFLHSERRKTGNCRYSAGTYGGNLPIRILILSSLLLFAGGSWVEALFHKMKDGHA
ncbi:hypothetical protein AAC387_Pa08g2027 [Persea americana]